MCERTTGNPVTHERATRDLMCWLFPDCTTNIEQLHATPWTGADNPVEIEGVFGSYASSHRGASDALAGLGGW